MWRGTTPTHVFYMPDEFSDAAFTDIYLSYAQRGKVILEKTLADITVSGTSLTVSLSQADTLLFHDGPVQIQMRGKLASGRTLASNIIHTNAREVLKDGEI